MAGAERKQNGINSEAETFSAPGAKDQRQLDQPEVLEALAAEANEYLTHRLFPILEPSIHQAKEIAEGIQIKFVSGEHITKEEIRDALNKLRDLIDSTKTKYVAEERSAKSIVSPATRLLLDTRRHRLLGTPLARASEFVRRMGMYLESLPDTGEAPPVLKEINVEVTSYLISPEDLTAQGEQWPRVPALFGEVKDLAKAKGVQLREEPPDEIEEEVRWHYQIMKEIVNELVKNAIEETPTGGSIVLALRKENGSAVLSIADTGRGINEENQKRIFEKGFSTKLTGTGQGLALVKSYIEGVLGGKVEVRSEEGEGTEFRLILPLFEAERDESFSRKLLRPSKD
jgi:signal transduction histidine kinase